ncbi:hypothetical protein SDC9_195432 [bioreactor metagenome]|uniref:Uncharacterized protein n=1 Tax=bioreactor metagenome TaxID=1076179 RepID=A0A645I9A3_9ZZZZ
MAADFVSGVANHVDDVRILFGEVAGKVEGRLDVVFFEDFQNQRSPVLEAFIA